VRGVEGHVDVRFVVDETGRVGDEELLADSPPGIFADAALRALRRWQFTPGRHAGRPVRVHMRIRIRFDLED
jgi:protein TonB